MAAAYTVGIDYAFANATGGQMVWGLWNSAWVMQYGNVSTSANNVLEVTWQNWSDLGTGLSQQLAVAQIQQATGNQTYAGLGDIWAPWNQQYMQLIVNGPATVLREVAPRVLTAEEVRQQEAAAASYRVEQEERRKAAEAAASKAEELLLKLLNPKQREQYRTNGWFDTEVNDKVYRIKKGRAGNIEQLDKSGKPVLRLCVHPEDVLPDADNCVAQYLALHTDEAFVLRTANHTRLQ